MVRNKPLKKLVKKINQNAIKSTAVSTKMKLAVLIGFFTNAYALVSVEQEAFARLFTTSMINQMKKYRETREATAELPVINHEPDPTIIRLAFHSCQGKCDAAFDTSHPFNQGMDVIANQPDQSYKEYVATWNIVKNIDENAILKARDAEFGCKKVETHWENGARHESLYSIEEMLAANNDKDLKNDLRNYRWCVNLRYIAPVTDEERQRVDAWFHYNDETMSEFDTDASRRDTEHPEFDYEDCTNDGEPFTRDDPRFYQVPVCQPCEVHGQKNYIGFPARCDQERRNEVMKKVEALFDVKADESFDITMKNYQNTDSNNDFHSFRWSDLKWTIQHFYWNHQRFKRESLSQEAPISRVDFWHMAMNEAYSEMTWKNSCSNKKILYH